VATPLSSISFAMERCSDDVVHDQGAEEASMGAKRHSFRPFSEAAPSTPLWRGIVIQFLSVGSETIRHRWWRRARITRSL
jgi:hypothetical protein